MTNHRFTVSPLTDDDIVLSESHLLTVLLELNRMGRLDDLTVHVYEESPDGRIYKGRTKASSVLSAGGVRENQIQT